ncbi:unnamed protein product [Rotaria sordida]|uniref:Macro domain-containing protein n=1 Tax=Rotaria sordida TaxID=392033 RepID=A0A818LS02_9BILA|nr:unnamed protein product [Rotaria sordida]CAF3577746.1 unnamed protein product [Rotaria sordida]
MATSISDDRNEIHFQRGSCNIILKPGDLLDEKDVDILVIPAPAGGLNPDNFLLFKTISSKADQYFKKEIDRVCSNLTQLEPQTISKNGLRYIFVVPPFVGNPKNASEYLRKTYISCLKLAVENNFQKIAFPTIGCGNIGFKINDAARSVYMALENFCQSNDGKKMNEIRIVIYDSKIYNEFTGTFMDVCRTKNIKFQHIPISTKISNPSEMSSTRDKRQITQRQLHGNDTTDYPDDFDDDADRHQQSGMTRQTSNLNPDSPEFQPKTNNKQRVHRRFLLKNNRTELNIIQGDILTIKVDAIVNAANESMLGGGGVDGVVHRAAGKNLRRACEAHKQIYSDVRLPTGHSRILLSYDLSTTTYYIINTAGPRYDDAPPDQCKKDLISCYKTSLALANLYDLETIAFTAISCGIFGYPIDEGAEVALETVDSKAGTMGKIWFVLKEDDIYDAWIKKAEELQFNSLDKSSTAATIRTSTQIHTNNQKTIEKSIKNNESTVSSKSPELNVIDASTVNNTQTAPKESKQTKQHEKSSQNQDEKSKKQATIDNIKDDNLSNKNEQTNKTNSERSNTDSREEQKTSDDSSKTKPTQNTNQKATSNKTDKSKTSTGEPHNKKQ